MHYRATNRHYLSESKIYKEGNYSYKVENNKYYYSTDGGKTWTEQTKPAGIEAIKAVIAKQGGDVSKKPTPPQNPTQYDVPGIYRSVNLPGYGSVHIDNRNYKNRALENGASDILIWAADGTDKTHLFNFECLTGGVDKDKFKGTVTSEMTEYLSDYFCGPEVRAKGLARVAIRTITGREGQKFEVALKKSKNEDIVNITSGNMSAFLWFSPPFAKFSCSGGNFTEGEDKFTNAAKPAEVASFITTVKNFCQTGM